MIPVYRFLKHHPSSPHQKNVSQPKDLKARAYHDATLTSTPQDLPNLIGPLKHIRLFLRRLFTVAGLVGETRFGGLGSCGVVWGGLRILGEDFEVRKRDAMYIMYHILY